MFVEPSPTGTGGESVTGAELVEGLKVGMLDEKVGKLDEAAVEDGQVARDDGG